MSVLLPFHLFIVCVHHVRAVQPRISCTHLSCCFGMRHHTVQAPTYPPPSPQPHHSAFCRVNYYPAEPEAPADAFGVHYHTDAGGLTILLQVGDFNVRLVVHVRLAIGVRLAIAWRGRVRVNTHKGTIPREVVSSHAPLPGRSGWARGAPGWAMAPGGADTRGPDHQRGGPAAGMCSKNSNKQRQQ